MASPIREKYTGGTYRVPKGNFYCQICGFHCTKRHKQHILPLGPEDKFKLKICSKCFRDLKEKLCDG